MSTCNGNSTALHLLGIIVATLLAIAAIVLAVIPPDPSTSPRVTERASAQTAA